MLSSFFNCFWGAQTWEEKHLSINSFIIRCFCLDHLSFPGCFLPTNQTPAGANHTVVSPDSPCGPANCFHVLICDHSPVTQRGRSKFSFLWTFVCISAEVLAIGVGVAGFGKNDKSDWWTSGAFCCVLLTWGQEIYKIRVTSLLDWCFELLRPMALLTVVANDRGPLTWCLLMWSLFKIGELLFGG